MRLQVQYEAEKARIVALEQSVQSKLEETLVVQDEILAIKNEYQE
ncbi:MAG: hypothetical protein WCR46_19950 [Deltaproteobacteria bacterium]